MPIIQHLRRDVYQVTWDPSRENGAHIELYSLEGKIERGKREKREVNFTLGNRKLHTYGLSYKYTTYGKLLKISDRPVDSSKN